MFFFFDLAAGKGVLCEKQGGLKSLEMPKKTHERKFFCQFWVRNVWTLNLCDTNGIFFRPKVAIG